MTEINGMDEKLEQKTREDVYTKNTDGKIGLE